MLALDEPVKPDAMAKGDPHAALLSHHPVSPFSVQYLTGEVFQGRTIGHVEVEQGLFLFPPLDTTGTASRIFIPRHAYKGFSVGERVGEILVAQAKLTQGQINQVVDEQDALRKRKLGDVLVSSQIISPDQLMEAIDMQSKLPVMRLGESLVALGMIPADALEGFVALGELALDGQLQPVAGVLPAALGASAQNKGIICPAENGAEAAFAIAGVFINNADFDTRRRGSGNRNIHANAYEPYHLPAQVFLHVILRVSSLIFRF